MCVESTPPHDLITYRTEQCSSNKVVVLSHVIDSIEWPNDYAPIVKEGIKLAPGYRYGFFPNRPFRSLLLAGMTTPTPTDTVFTPYWDLDCLFSGACFHSIRINSSQTTQIKCLVNNPNPYFRQCKTLKFNNKSNGSHNNRKVLYFDTRIIFGGKIEVLADPLFEMDENLC